ncbi:MAG: hypothetical protein LW823_03465 [Rickettsiales bacterium]|jgi:hypothetical protein|nr:hypothetical protein [Rickettsiales bacterium]
MEAHKHLPPGPIREVLDKNEGKFPPVDPKRLGFYRFTSAVANGNAGENRKVEATLVTADSEMPLKKAYLWLQESCKKAGLDQIPPLVVITGAHNNNGRFVKTEEGVHLVIETTDQEIHPSAKGIIAHELKHGLLDSSMNPWQAEYACDKFACDVCGESYMRNVYFPYFIAVALDRPVLADIPLEKILFHDEFYGFRRLIDDAETDRSFDDKAHPSIVKRIHNILGKDAFPGSFEELDALRDRSRSKAGWSDSVGDKKSPAQRGGSNSASSGSKTV